MRNKQQDKIIYLKDKILHQAAGGFVFYKSHLGEIYKRQNLRRLDGGFCL